MTEGALSFYPKEITCPVCEQDFTRHTLRKTQFSIIRRDVDYRPVYRSPGNPRLFMICICPHCFYTAEDRFFCPKVSEEEVRRQGYFTSHNTQRDAKIRQVAGASAPAPWKDPGAENLKELLAADLTALKRVQPLLKRAAAGLLDKGKPIDELQRDLDLDTAIRSFELAAICYKARRASHRILGYTYLNGAWCCRDVQEKIGDETSRHAYHTVETAFLREAVALLTIAHNANTGFAFYPDGMRIPQENLPAERLFEIKFILAGAHRLLENKEESAVFLEQIVQASDNAQGIILWFVNQARNMLRSDGNDEFSQSRPGDQEPFPDTIGE